MSDLPNTKIEVPKHPGQPSEQMHQLSSALVDRGFNKDAQACSISALTDAQSTVDQNFGQCELTINGKAFITANGDEDHAHKYQFTQVDKDGGVKFSTYDSNKNLTPTLIIDVPNLNEQAKGYGVTTMTGDSFVTRGAHGEELTVQKPNKKGEGAAVMKFSDNTSEQITFTAEEMSGFANSNHLGVVEMPGHHFKVVVDN